MSTLQLDALKTLGLAKPSKPSAVNGTAPLSPCRCVLLQAPLAYINQPKLFLITKLYRASRNSLCT
jgi:hypothetical protein